ncbi:penicillin-binding protein 1A [Alphaproteobacteria bacterium]|nr:penicillin-binding protein 1A [Alphaproteobacteria bacterium]
MIIRILIGFLGLSLILAIALVFAGLFIFDKYGRDLPDYQKLATYEPPTMTRVHAADGRVLIEYATEPRVFVPIAAIPINLIHAFLAAEDDTFYEHSGIAFSSIFRAVITNTMNFWSNKRPVGASTITQQVAKNFFLSNEVSIERKIKEAILAFRIERALTKSRILELYLNEIYLGFGSYGVAAAALSYFDKSLDQLSLPELAYLAALPKAPSHYHPIKNLDAATDRRNWVLSRMADEGFISSSSSKIAQKLPLRVFNLRKNEFVIADYFTETIRKDLLNLYGEKGLYEGGLSVRTSLDPYLQFVAKKSLNEGLINYDKRHGYRGPLSIININDDWLTYLKKIDKSENYNNYKVAVVLEIFKNYVKIGLSDNSHGTIELKELLWARKTLNDQKVGKKIKHSNQVLLPGYVILVEEIYNKSKQNTYKLRQLVNIQGAIVVLDPHTGRVLAMEGGFDYSISQFNRATQAMRQPGSAFKPFVYVAALENGFTPASKVLDAPFVIDQGGGLGWWKPANFKNRFYGPSTLRLGIEKSRNLMTVRLAQFLGMEVISDYADKFGITENMPELLSMSLGAGETTLLKLTAAYAMLVNGGKFIEPSLIDRIQDRRGKTIMRKDQRVCSECIVEKWNNQNEPVIKDDRKQVVTPEAAYQMVSMLQGVVQRGTGRSIRSIGKHLAGKTGTTNDGVDTWFIGFSADLVVGVFVGFDQPRTLGPNEQGASVAAPIFKSFMAEALKNKADIPFRIPKGVRLVRIDGNSGLPADKKSKNILFEAFRPGSEPKELGPILDGFQGQKRETGSGIGSLY